ncbi:Itc1 protein [Starmerella bacillaris]|uniref:Itc1 protein n=1 Tax=Starmerella bacillaris TaxID=1247836 RepID=A0AAV5RFK8_STABA|nr:Itc1 protein [Starmerella bacillaris]
MVLFKRKQVNIPRPKYTHLDDDQMVWVIPETLEYFCTYEDYLDRLDFYNQKKFICELTGSSCLTFFDALRREQYEKEFVLKRFPEPLKRPILQEIHFSTTTRLDQLVDEIYNSLKEKYFEHEFVTVRYADQRVRAEIIKAENGIYQVDDGRRILEGDASQLQRDRKVLSKISLRTFVKHAATREQWLGAPWIVNKEFVQMYNLDNVMPPEVCRIYEKKRFEEIGDAKQAELATLSELKALDANQVSFNDDFYVFAREAGVQPMRKYVEKRAESSPFPQWHVDERLSELEEHNKVSSLLEIWTFTTIFCEYLKLDKKHVLSLDAFIDQLRQKDVSEAISSLHEAILILYVSKSKRQFQVPFKTATAKTRKKRSVKSEKRRKQDNDKHDVNSADHEVEGDADVDVDAEASMDVDADNVKVEADAEMEVDGDEKNDATEEVAENVTEDHSDAGTSDDEEEEKELVKRILGNQFSDGGWQELVACILTKLLNQTPFQEETKETLKFLHASKSRDNDVAANYRDMPFVYRVHALFILLRALYESPTFKQLLEARFEEAAKLRKIPIGKEVRHLRETIRSLQRGNNAKREKEDRKSTKKGEKEKDKGKGKGKKENDKENTKENEKENDKDNVKEEDLEELDEAKLKEEYNIKCAESDKIAQKISKLETQRMAPLGLDMFYNRYYWIGSDPENNDDYGLGRICIQGPSLEEITKCLNSEEFYEDLKQYRQHSLEEEHKKLKLQKYAQSLESSAKKEQEKHDLDAVVDADNADTAAKKIERKIRQLLSFNKATGRLSSSQAAELRALEREALALNCSPESLRNRDSSAEIEESQGSLKIEDMQSNSDKSNLPAMQTMSTNSGSNEQDQSKDTQEVKEVREVREVRGVRQVQEIQPSQVLQPHIEQVQTVAQSELQPVQKSATPMSTQGPSQFVQPPQTIPPQQAPPAQPQHGQHTLPQIVPAHLPQQHAPPAMIHQIPSMQHMPPPQSLMQAPQPPNQHHPGQVQLIDPLQREHKLPQSQMVQQLPIQQFYHQGIPDQMPPQQQPMQYIVQNTMYGPMVFAVSQPLGHPPGIPNNAVYNALPPQSQYPVINPIGYPPGQFPIFNGAPSIPSGAQGIPHFFNQVPPPPPHVQQMMAPMPRLPGPPGPAPPVYVDQVQQMQQLQQMQQFQNNPPPQHAQVVPPPQHAPQSHIQQPQHVQPPLVQHPIEAQPRVPVLPSSTGSIMQPAANSPPVVIETPVIQSEPIQPQTSTRTAESNANNNSPPAGNSIVERPGDAPKVVAIADGAVTVQPEVPKITVTDVTQSASNTGVAEPAHKDNEPLVDSKDSTLNTEDNDHKQVADSTDDHKPENTENTSRGDELKDNAGDNESNDNASRTLHTKDSSNTNKPNADSLRTVCAESADTSQETEEESCTAASAKAVVKTPTKETAKDSSDLSPNVSNEEHSKEEHAAGNTDDGNDHDIDLGIDVDEDIPSPTEIRDIFQGSFAILKPNQWRFYETPEELAKLFEYLVESGTRGSKLLLELRKHEVLITSSMTERLSKLGLN